ncbi:MAG: RES family NAD+ phosphorylase [Gammaproteobacteria bacterium]|nr:RES family NAD+ phosphorylase [Gammaproteobacteria bacterium]MDH5799680.1 RES family NAD+ phosphorylase [Gammaproteobacteria bacterium]
MTPRISETFWPKAFRIISSRFPPIGIFDKVAKPEDLEAIFYVESLTNPRLRDQMGAITLVKPEDRLSGQGTTPIMAAFTHLNPSGSRFSNGEYGVYYAANQRQTAIAETVFHVARWAKESNDPPTSFVMRVYIGRLNKKPYHDLRDQETLHPEYFNPDPSQYGPPQQLAATLRQAGSWGLLYHSVRDASGECVAAFRPPALGNVHQGPHLAFHWDGKNIVDVLELRSLGLPA